MKKIWPFSFYFLYFAAFSSLLPYFVLFYQSLGFSGAQIGLLTGVPPLISLFGAPFGTGLADRTQRHKLIMGTGLVVAIAVMLVLPHMSSFALVFALIVLFNFFMSPVASLSDSATMTMLGEQREMYGRIRIGGTIGWGIFAQIAGFLLALYGVKILFYMFSSIMLINLFVSQKFSFGEPEKQDEKTGTMRLLLKDRRWIIFLASAFLGGIGAFSVAAYLSPYLQELGADGRQIGFAFLVATLTELPAFFFANLLVKRFTAYRLFVISLILLGVRSLLFGIAGNLYLAIALQGLGGVIFPAMWAAGVAYADANAPVGLKSTAQGLFGSMTFGFGAAVSGFVGGLLLERIGGRGMFLVFGVIILAGLLLIEAVKRFIPEKELARAEV
ncbi:MAG TPA: major facilitator superfamily domain-containing protein 6 [Anaerolineales bacterium]|nr:major facilitator superfamily domain-containing protein 6 [Anaerolineales bacterium]